MKFQESNVTDPIDRVLYADFNSYLPDDLMVKVDIASMIVALEGRSPLLDHKFLELTAQIPSRLKLKGRNKKYIFKQALRGIVPDENLDRKKMGFGVPIDFWFRGQLKDYLSDTLLSTHALNRGLFKREAIERLLNTHTTTAMSYASQLWALLTLELWFRSFIDKN